MPKAMKVADRRVKQSLAAARGPAAPAMKSMKAMKAAAAALGPAASAAPMKAMKAMKGGKAKAQIFCFVPRINPNS